jgi:hypothetical protein
LAALGVNNVCSTLPSPRLDESWSVEGLTRLRERVESAGIHLDAVPLPLSSAYITRAENPNIVQLGIGLLSTAALVGLILRTRRFATNPAVAE